MENKPTKPLVLSENLMETKQNAKVFSPKSVLIMRSFMGVVRTYKSFVLLLVQRRFMYG